VDVNSILATGRMEKQGHFDHIFVKNGESTPDVDSRNAGWYNADEVE